MNGTHPAFLCDAFDDIRGTDPWAPAYPLECDPELGALLDAAAVWLECAAAAALALGGTLPQGIAALMPRRYSGYLPKAQRNAVAHGLYSMGIRKAPRRETSADQAQARAVQMGLAS